MPLMPQSPTRASPFRKRLSQVAIFCLFCGAGFFLGSLFGNNAWIVFRVLAGLFGLLLLSAGTATLVDLWQTRNKNYRVWSRSETADRHPGK